MMSRKTKRAVPDQRVLRHHRALFLSDLHLGGHGCKADSILEFLQTNSADKLYLVGDILDIWHPVRPYWTEVHDSILSLILLRASKGMEVVYLTGNHDAALTRRFDRSFAGFQIVPETVHRTANGQSFLVLHGDCVDSRVLRWHICTRIGTRIDGALRGLDDALRRLRRHMPQDQRSLIERFLGGVNAIMATGTKHERRLTALARIAGQDGIICGHFHKPALHRIDGILYANCGDWVDSFTALAEDAEGQLRLIRFVGAEESYHMASPAPTFKPVGMA